MTGSFGTNPDTGAAGRPTVSLRNLRKNYGSVEAVRGVSLDVHAGEVVVIIGPSGCGKSTTLRCLNLLEEPTGGTPRVGDRELDFANRRSLPTGRNLARFRARFGMVFQQFDLFAHKTALQNVMVGPTVGPEDSGGGSPQPRHGAPGPRRPLGHGGPAAARALRRPAAAGRHSPRACDEARGAAVRRGDLGARPGAGRARCWP